MENAFNFLIVSLMLWYFVYKIFLLPAEEHRNWLSWPTIEEYRSEYPHCQTRNGMQCAYCGSKSIFNKGWDGFHDSRRIHKCNHCGKNLYRTGER